VRLCLHGTDTGLGFGPAAAEWALASLRLLGLPDDQAEQLVRVATGGTGGTVPMAEVTVTIRICRSCLSRSDLATTGMRVGGLPDLPIYGPPR
jgi:phosphodiesterase PdeA-like protein